MGLNFFNRLASVGFVSENERLEAYHKLLMSFVSLHNQPLMKYDCRIQKMKCSIYLHSGIFQMKLFSRLFVIVLLTQLTIQPLTGLAHHSFFGRFDNSTHMVLEGTITRLHWQNPHIHIFLEVTNDDGTVTEWDLESGSPTLMQRAGIPRDSLEEGMQVRVAAWPPLTEKVEAFATNVLLPDGTELLMQTGQEAYFKDEVTGDFSYRFRTVGDRSHPELGIFRMWTFTGADGFLFPESINRDYDMTQYPLTDVALEILENFDLARDNPTNNCQPKGMPLIMEQPLPMEIIRDGDNVVLRIEEYDLVRTIHIGEEGAPSDTPHSLLGYSWGWWESSTGEKGVEPWQPESTLVVETSHISFPWLNQRGIPLSRSASIEERFTMIEDGAFMDYTMVITDAVNLTTPVQLSKKWIHVPGVEILPFECDEISGE